MGVLILKPQYFLKSSLFFHEDIQFVALAVSVKGCLVKPAYAGDEASVLIEKEKTFLSQFPSKMKDTSIVALLQGCLHRNICDPLLSIFVGLCPVVRCMSGIQAPAILIFEQALQKEAHSGELYDER